MTAKAPADIGASLRALARGARVASLATVSAGGEPFASLVTPAFMPDFSPLLLLSGLSEHTRHLRADPRAALLVVGEATGPNPQTAPRVTLTGLAAPIDDPRCRARYLAIHPYAALYAGFGDFALWSLTLREAHYVGGFGAARRVGRAKFQPDPEAVATIAAAEADIIVHCNRDHADALAAIAGAAGEWRMAALDLDGCDLAAGEEVRRITFPAPLAGADDVRGTLIRLARRARGE